MSRQSAGKAGTGKFPWEATAAPGSKGNASKPAVINGAAALVPFLSEAKGPAEPSNEPVSARVIVSLAASGQLQMELPGAAALGLRTVLLKPGKEAEGLRRVLEAQARSRAAIGEDGLPTRAQVRHWEQHSTFPSHSCPFCVSEGRAQGKRKARPGPAEQTRGDGSVKVRVIPARPSLRSKKSSEELGL